MTSAHIKMIKWHYSNCEDAASTNVLHIFKRFQKLKRNIPEMKRRMAEIKGQKKVLMEETSKLVLRNRYRIAQLYAHCGCPYGG